MPIRLNLLAETQAEEELRRRDPVKRAIWVAGFFVGCILIYFVGLLVLTMVKRSNLTTVKNRLAAQETQFKGITDNEKKLTETNRKLESLRYFAANRFLWGNVLNTLQQSTVEGVQLTQFRGEQIYVTTEEVKQKTNESGRVVLGRPGYTTEKVALYISAKDISANGDQINKFKQKLEQGSFIKKNNSTNAPALAVTLKNLSPPTIDPDSGKSAIFFSLESRFPEREIK